MDGKLERERGETPEIQTRQQRHGHVHNPSEIRPLERFYSEKPGFFPSL